MVEEQAGLDTVGWGAFGPCIASSSYAIYDHGLS